MGGTALFFTLGLLHTVTKNKMPLEIPIPLQYLPKHDHGLLVHLCELHRNYKQVAPILCDRILYLCDELIGLRVTKSTELQKARDIHSYIVWNLKRLIQLQAPDPNLQRTFTFLERTINVHLEAIHAVK